MNATIRNMDNILAAYPLCNRLRQTLAPHMNHIISPRQLDSVALISQYLNLTRWVLLLLTASLYLVRPLASPGLVQTVVITTMVVATVMAQSLYNSEDLKPVFAAVMLDRSCAPVRESKRLGLSHLRLLITAETIGIALLILPTGGIGSPFVWYVINPLLAAAIYLPWAYCWGILVVFLFTAVGAAALYPGLPAPLLSFLAQQAAIMLVFVFLTALVQVAAHLCRKLLTAYNSMGEAHANTQAAFAHISSLYQALEALSGQEDEAKLARLLAEYTTKLCSAPGICLLLCPPEHEPKTANPVVMRASKAFPAETILPIMRQYWPEAEPGSATIRHHIPAMQATLYMAPIYHQVECFGLLAYLGPAVSRAGEQDSLEYLARLGGMTLERLKANQLWGRLLVTEEQNRIANEIHDGVAQYLFSMVCALHSLARQDLSLQNQAVQEQLQLLTDTAQRASRELRASIYQLSPRQRGDNAFLNNLASYLDDLGRLHCLRVDLRCEGQEENLSPVLRQALYRVVREASSNALRHGKCSSLQVSLRMHPGRTEMAVKDNGKGFNPRSKAEHGMGFTNMRQLVERFDGTLTIDSDVGEGTIVKLRIPR